MALRGINAIVLTPPHHIEITDDLSGGVAEPVLKFGFQANVTAPANDVWSGTALTLPIPTQPGGQQMGVKSSSASDAAAGTGVRTLMIHYIDSSGNEQTETVTMNGTTEVDTIATNIRFINLVHSMTTGSNNSAVGTIIVFPAGTPATVFTQIDPGHNNDLNTAYMVPAGKILIIQTFSASGGQAHEATIYLRATADEGLLLPPTIFIDIDAAIVLNSQSVRDYSAPVIIPSLAVVKCTAFAAANGADVQASYKGILVPSP